MIIADVKQGTPEWLALKAGIPSASDFDKIVQMNGKPSKQRDKYLYQLAGERIAGIREEGYINGAMQRGIELEPEAIAAFELIEDVEISKVGACYKDDKRSFLCSPDGLSTDKKTGLEIKCPSIPVHVENLVKNKMPAAYFQQVQGSLFVTGLEAWYFMSYYPGLKPFVIRIERDEAFIAALEIELNLFCAELEQVVEKIK